MALSASQRKANYKQVKLSMPKEEAETLETYCIAHGWKKAGFIRTAIKEKMERDQEAVDGTEDDSGRNSVG